MARDRNYIVDLHLRAALRVLPIRCSSGCKTGRSSARSTTPQVPTTSWSPYQRPAATTNQPIQAAVAPSHTGPPATSTKTHTDRAVNNERNRRDQHPPRLGRNGHPAVRAKRQREGRDAHRGRGAKQPRKALRRKDLADHGERRHEEAPDHEAEQEFRDHGFPGCNRHAPSRPAISLHGDTSTRRAPAHHAMGAVSDPVTALRETAPDPPRGAAVRPAGKPLLRRTPRVDATQ